MFTPLLGLAAFVAVALIGLGAGILKYKTMPYEKDAEEKAAEAKAEEQFTKNGYKEQSINDILKTLTYTGFAAC